MKFLSSSIFLLISFSIISTVRNNILATTTTSTLYDENFYVNIKQAVSGLFIGKINDSNKKFEAPYYIIPSQPLDLDELKRVLNVNLDTGKIYLSTDGNSVKLDKYKFTILSILKGTSKQINVNFIQPQQDDLKAGSTSLLTTSDLNLMLSTKTVMLEKLKILKSYFFLLSKRNSNLKQNTIVGNIDLATLNSTLECRYYCNFKKILSYFSFDRKTSNLVMLNNNLDISFLTIEIYNDDTTVLLVYLKFLSLPIDWNHYSALVLNGNTTSTITTSFAIDNSRYYSFINYTNFQTNGFIQLFNNNLQSAFNQFQIQINATNEVFQTINFVAITCPNITYCSYTFNELTAKFENEIRDINSINNCSTSNLNAEIYLDRLFVSNKQPIYNLNSSFFFDYEFANLSATMGGDFNQYFLFQNGIISQFNYLPATALEYQLIIDIFNVTFDKLNDKTNPYFYTCRLNLDLKIVSKQVEQIGFYKKLYSLNISSTSILNSSTNEVVLKNFQSETQKSCHEFKMINLTSLGEIYIELNSLTGDLIIFNKGNFNNRQFNKYDFEIVCVTASYNQSISTFVELNFIEDGKKCLPTLRPHNSTINYTLNKQSSDMIKVPKSDFISQMLVSECDSRTFNSRNFGFNLTSNNGSEFNNYFHFNITNGILSTSNSDFTFINYTLYQTNPQMYEFEFSVQVFDLLDFSLATNKSFKLKLNIMNSNQASNSNLSDVYFINNVLFAEIEENVDNGTFIKYINKSLISVANVTSLQKYVYKLVDPTFTFLLENDSVLVLPKITTNKAIDRELTNNYTLFLYMVDRDTHQTFYDSCAILVNILDVNDNVPILNLVNKTNLIEISLHENLNAVYEKSIKAVDYDIGENGRLTYEIKNFSAINNNYVTWFTNLTEKFNINTQTGLFVIKQPLDYELYSKYEFNILISDNGFPSLQLMIKLVINVIDVNDNAPKFDDTAILNDMNLIRIDLISNFTYQLSSPTDEVYLTDFSQYTTDIDSGLNNNNKFNFSLAYYEILIQQSLFKNVNIYLIFRIDSYNGQLYCRLWPTLQGTANSIQFDSNFTSSTNEPNIYNLIVVTSDMGLPKPLKSSKSIQLSISMNINNKTTFNLFKNNLQLLLFNSTPLLYQNTLIANIDEGLSVQTFALKFQTYSTISMKWLIWFKIISGNYDNSFQIENGFINDTGIQVVNVITNRILDREIRSVYRIKIAVFYQTNTTNTNEKLLLTDYAYLYVNVIDVNDNAPNFLMATSNFILNENYPINKQITKITAYDSDAFNVIQYSLIDYNAQRQQNLLNIDPFTGIITANLTIDYEQIKVLNYKISAFDGVFRTNFDFQIIVTDINDNLPLMQNRQLQDRIEMETENISNLNFYGFDYDATEENSRIFYRIYNINSLNSSNILVTNQTTLDVNALKTSSNLSVFLVHLNNYSPVFNTFLQPNNVEAYSIVYIISNGGQQHNKGTTSGLKFELNEYLFFVNKLNQIGNKISSIKIIWTFGMSTASFLQNVDFKVKSNQSLPFKCVLNRNQSTIDIFITDYLIEKIFNFEIVLTNNITNVSIIVYDANSLFIKNSESINLNITNSSFNKIKKFEIFNSNIDRYELSLLNSEDSVFSLLDSVLVLNKTKFESILFNLRPDSVNLVEYCLIDGGIQISSELVISVTTSLDSSIFNMNSISTNLYISCDYLMELPQLVNTYNLSANFALSSYNIQMSENPSASSQLISFHYYPEKYAEKKGFKAQFYTQNTIFFTIDLMNAVLKPNNTLFDFENSFKREYNFQVFGAIQSADTIVESISTNVHVQLNDLDEYKPVITIQAPIIFIYANTTGQAMITKFNATDEDSGASGRTLFYLYEPSNFTKNYFYLNKFTGELVLQSSICQLTLNSVIDDDIIQNSILLSNSILVELYIKACSGLPNSLYSIAKLQIFVDYNCLGCFYSINNTNTQTNQTTRPIIIAQATASSFLNSIWAIVLICAFGFIALFLAVLLIALKLRKSCKPSSSAKRTTKPNASKQTSESSLFYNSSNASTCSHVSDKSALSFSKNNQDSTVDDNINNQSNQQLINQNHDSLSSRSTTIINSNSFRENKSGFNNELIKKLTIPLSSTINTNEDKFQYLHPICSNERNRSHFKEYLNRLGIQQTDDLIGDNEDNNMQKPKSPSILTTSISHINDLPRQHYYFNYQSSNDNFEDIDNVMVDLKEIVSDSSLANADIKSLEEYARLNRLKIERQQQQKISTNNPVFINSNTIVTSGSDICSYNNSTIGSNFNDDELSFQKWDTLLDWTPQYAPLSNIFDDLTRLNSENQFEMQKLKNYEIFDDDDDVNSSIEINDVLSISNNLFVKNSLALEPEFAEIMSRRKLKKQADKDYQDCFNEENDSEI